MKANLLDVYHDAVIARDQSAAQVAELESRQMALDELLDAVRNWSAAFESQEEIDTFEGLKYLQRTEQALLAAWDSYHATALVAEEREKMAKRTSVFNPRDPVAYIPDHATDITHPDVEFGFVTSVKNALFVYCRYWTKNLSSLRTKSNSEMTPKSNLFHYEHPNIARAHNDDR